MDANYGGTELCAALEYTFENKTKQQVNGKPIPVAVFVLTDGETGDISNIVTAVSQAVAKAEAENGLLRVFVLGIADDVSTRVCEKNRTCRQRYCRLCRCEWPSGPIC